MIEITDVQKGVSRIVRSKIQILDTLGNSLNGQITDAILNSNLDEMSALASKLGYNLETLMLESSRIATANKKEDETQIPYFQLPVSERQQIANFLWRPANERQLTYFEEVLLLHALEIIKLPSSTKSFGEIRPIYEAGLRKILRYQIERNFDEPLSKNDLQKLWEQKDWLRYVENPSVGHKITGDKSPSYNFSIPIHNLPVGFKTILADVRTYLDGTNNLDKIVETAKPIINQRADLARVNYFSYSAQEGERMLIIDKAIRGIPVIF
jgi:hypothetical protein